MAGYIMNIISTEIPEELTGAIPISPTDILVSSATLAVSGLAFFVACATPWMVNPYVWARALPWAAFGLTHMVQLILVSTSGGIRSDWVHAGQILNGCFFVYFMIFYLLYAFVGPLRPLKDTFKKAPMYATGQQFMYGSPMAYQTSPQHVQTAPVPYPVQPVPQSTYQSPKFQPIDAKKG